MAHDKHISDTAIITLFFERDERAIAAIECKYGPLLSRIAYRILGDAGESEECCNDVYLRAWNAIPPEKPVILPAYLSRLMRNVAINRYKQKKAKKAAPLSTPLSLEELYAGLHDEETPDKTVEAAELGALLNTYVRGLTKKQQAIFVGRFYMNDTVEEVAARLGVTPSAVYKATEKIKAGLKDYLQKNGVYV